VVRLAVALVTAEDPATPMRARPPTLRLLTGLTVAALVGCHRPVQPLERPQDAYQRAVATPDAALETWILARPPDEARPIASAKDSAGAQLEAPAMRRLVLERHPRIMAAQAEIAQAEALRRAAGAWPNPELEARVLLDGPSAGEIEAAIGLTLPVSGRLAAARRAADVDLSMAQVALEAARHEALLEVDDLLVALAHQRRHVALAEELARSSGQLEALVRQRQAASLADPLDVTIVLAEAARDRGSLARERTELAAIEGRLYALMGLEPGSAQLVPPTISRTSLAEDRDALIEAAAGRRTSWLLARLELERAEWAAREAARARIPEPSLGPALVGDPEAFNLGLRVGLPIPLLSPGGAAYRAAVADRDAAHWRLVAEGHEAVREIDALVTELRGLEEALDALSGASLGSARQAARLAQDRYEAGQIDVLHLQSARRAWAAIETETLDLLLDIRHAQLELERAVGRPLTLTLPTPETP
jgi:outer membrane protein TolC